ncbi:unnamed protein product [Chondrus crispus]|uniref:Uncharacterized protein n=1 Tax=Chondrus crispus TaxID=2769 RepID=R7QVS3_CHOCR|nr:unnamed protein product [Chondrus crispus]CDF41410.1 unnamed protein product [Chondrus crispus]|eukprot:XP_005711704.1 unnamed protein product [Chondrus crispus]
MILYRYSRRQVHFVSIVGGDVKNRPK